MDKLCKITHAQNKNSDLEITSQNVMFLFIQVITKLRLQQKNYFDKSKHKGQIITRKLQSVFLLKTEIRISRTPQVIKFYITWTLKQIFY